MKRLWTAGAVVAVLALAGCGGAGSATTEEPTQTATAAEGGSGGEDVGLTSEGHEATEGAAYTVHHDDDYRTVVSVNADQLAELSQLEVSEDSVADVIAALSDPATYAEHTELADYADDLAQAAADETDQLTTIITGIADGSVPALRIAASHAVQDVTVTFGTRSA